MGVTECCRQANGDAQEASQVERLPLVPLKNPIQRLAARVLEYEDRTPFVTSNGQKNGVCDKEPSVMETHFGRFFCGDAYDKSARKQSGQPGCEPNAHPSWVGDGSLLIKCFQCSSDNRFRTGARSD